MPTINVKVRVQVKAPVSRKMKNDKTVLPQILNFICIALHSIYPLCSLSANIPIQHLYTHITQCTKFFSIYAIFPIFPIFKIQTKFCIATFKMIDTARVYCVATCITTLHYSFTYIALLYYYDLIYKQKHALHSFIHSFCDLLSLHSKRK